MKATIILFTSLACLGWSLAAGSSPTQPGAIPQPSPFYEADESITQDELGYQVIGYVEMPGLNTPAIPKVLTMPEYPTELKANRVQGTVNVTFTVDEHGNVINPAIEKSTNREFNRASLDAIVQWKYWPALKDGKPVQVKVRLPISYTLRR